MCFEQQVCMQGHNLGTPSKVEALLSSGVDQRDAKTLPSSPASAFIPDLQPRRVSSNGQRLEHGRPVRLMSQGTANALYTNPGKTDSCTGTNSRHIWSEDDNNSESGEKDLSFQSGKVLPGYETAMQPMVRSS